MQIAATQDPEQIFLENFKPEANFERAIFISWYCSVGDCTFCYMSTQKSRIKDPKKARRSLESVIAEAIIIKNCNWNIEFVSGGYGGFSKISLLTMLKHIKQIYGKKLWLNVGVVNEHILTALQPYLEGVCGAIETVNPEVHKKVCPSKPIQPYLNMFKTCDKLGLKKAITIIIGLGETLDDFQKLKDLIEEYKIERITFYPLNPIQGTVFENTSGPDSEYVLEWIRKTRINFPKLEIIAGPWVGRVEQISSLLKAGANSITKFPGIKLFNTKYAKEFENQIKSAGRECKGTLTKVPEINIDKEVNQLDLTEEQKQTVKTKLQEYLKVMKNN